MRLLVTGGSGYLGSEIVRRACEAGHQAAGVATRDFDVRDAAAVRHAVESFAPAAVIHTAYRQDGPGFREINADGAANVAGAAAAARARLVHLSTDVVFDGRRGGGYAEDDPACPVTEYGASKAAAEPLVAAAHPDATIVRTSLIYGGRTPSRHEVAALEPDGVFYTNEIRCPVVVSELAEALLELVALDAAGPLHLAGPDAVSRCEFARLVARRDVRCAPAPETRPLDCTLDCTRAQGLLRTRLRGVHEVLG
jgi:dTDP-4-dehydrorhamnose reductase